MARNAESLIRLPVGGLAAFDGSAQRQREELAKRSRPADRRLGSYWLPAHIGQEIRATGEHRQAEIASYEAERRARFAQFGFPEAASDRRRPTNRKPAPGPNL
jgi:hypothetical protein